MEQIFLDMMKKLTKVEEEIDSIREVIEETAKRVENLQDTLYELNHPDTNRECTFKFITDKDWEPMSPACWSGCPFSFLIPLGKCCRCIEGEYTCPFVDEDRYEFQQGEYCSE